MNRTFYNILGILAILSGISLIMTGRDIVANRPPEKPILFYTGGIMFVGLCGLIAITCFFPQSHPITLRILGFIGLISCIFIIVDNWHHPNLGQLGLIFLFWLPGSIYLIITGQMTDV